MRDGSRIEPRAKLKLKGDTLTGVTFLQPGQETPIVDAKIEGELVQWSVVREQNGRKVTTRYQGKLTGDTLKGFIESDWTGAVQRYDWEARRAPDTPAGTWRWASVAAARRTNDAPVTENSRERVSSQSSTNNSSRSGSAEAGARGGDVRGVFKVDNDHVTGKIIASRGGIDISHGRFRNGEFSFRIVRDRDGVRSVTEYRGKLEGNIIKGTIESETDDGKKTRPWEATRVDD